MTTNTMKRLGLSLVVLASFVCVFAAGVRETYAQVRGLKVEANENSKMAVFVDVDRKDRKYAEDDLLVATVKSDMDGYLYLLHVDPENNTSVLLPNEWYNDNHIKANETVSYPYSNTAPYRFRVSGPTFGKEQLVAVVSRTQLDSIKAKDYAKGAFKPLKESDKKSLSEEFAARSKNLVADANPNASSEVSDSDYAVHYVDFETTAKRSQTTPSKRIFAVCIGVGSYKDQSIPSLPACDADVEKMTEVFQNVLGIDEDNCLALCNEDATRENIQKIFVDLLPAVTCSGDTIILYWTGHGTSVQGVVSENDLHNSQFLIPYDADRSSSSQIMATLIHEDAFGNWVRQLSGRNILFFLDSCYSGGLLNSSKSVALPRGGLKGAFDNLENGNEKAIETPKEPSQFGMNMFERSKALGQNGLYVLTSSSDDETSMVRRDGKMSVMTYELAKTLEAGSSSMTQRDLYEPVKDGVDAYMKAEYPGKRQSVLVQDELGFDMKIRK